MVAAASELAEHSNGHWPPQLYVRDARRMRGKHVLTQHHLAAGTGLAAAMAGSTAGEVHAVDVAELRHLLRADGQLLDEPEES